MATKTKSAPKPAPDVKAAPDAPDPAQTYADLIAKALACHDQTYTVAKGATVSRSTLRLVAHGNGATSDDPSAWAEAALKRLDTMLETARADCVAMIGAAAKAQSLLDEASAIESEGGIGGVSLARYGFAPSRRFGARALRSLLAGERLGKRLK